MGGPGILLALAACAAPGPTQADRWRLEVPPVLAHWRASMEADLSAASARFATTAARWPAGAASGPLHVILAGSPAEARRLAASLDLAGDAAVPRTWPARRLSILPLPRRDRLLATLPAPPRTLRETLRHEAIHLLAVERPGLGSAPPWFLEGLAELLAADPGDAGDPWSGLGAARCGLGQSLHAAPPADPVLDLALGLPAELRYAAWAALAGAALARAGGPEPWNSVSSWSAGRLLQEGSFPGGAPGLVGREADTAPGGAGPFLLASRPGRAVEFRWPGALGTGTPWEGELEIGPTTLGEVSVLLDSAEGATLRLRFRASGQARADLEAPGETAATSLGGLPPSALPGKPRLLQVRVAASGLDIRTGSLRERVPWTEVFRPPLRLRFQVRDGVVRVVPAGGNAPLPSGP